jgi:hypothetical protein
MLTIKQPKKSKTKKRYFSIEEANKMIPDLEFAFNRITQLHHHISTLYAQLDHLGLAPKDEDFDPAPDGLTLELIDLLTSLKVLLMELRAQVNDLHQSGCIVKDVVEGLVDWHSKHDDRDVFLCWKFGEKQVQHWHEIDSGFETRKRLRT